MRKVDKDKVIRLIQYCERREERILSELPNFVEKLRNENEFNRGMAYGISHIKDQLIKIKLNKYWGG